MVKNLPANARHNRCGFSFWVRKNPWRRKWQPTPVFLPGKTHGQRSLVDYSPWGCKELDTTEQQALHGMAPYKTQMPHNFHVECKLHQRVRNLDALN